MRRLTLCCLLMAILIIGFTGCAGNGMPTLPSDNPQFSEAAFTEGQGRELIGVWDFYYDGSDLSVTNATERYVSAVHWDVKKFLKPPFCSDCLQISNIVDDPVEKILSVDVTIKNPFKIEGADPRGIFMGNIAAIHLSNADDFTDFWNEYNGMLNGFKLFGKELQDGIFGEGAQATETFEIKYNFTPFFFSTSVDAIYPADSLREPYSIANQAIDGSLDIDGNLTRILTVDVFDRNDDHGVVSVICDELLLNLTLTQDPGDINHFSGSISNSSHAAAGDYTAMIVANDSVTRWALYDFFTITISEDIGTWVATQYSVPNSGCPADIATGFNFMTGDLSIFYPAGESCDEIGVIDGTFTTPQTAFGLNNIDPLIPGFSPFPVKRLDTSTTGGLAFFVDSEEIYSDDFYTGPYSSLMVTLVPDFDGNLGYVNNGDGDAGRIPAVDPGLRGIDVCDDMQGNLYGLWADPDGIMNPIVYGLIFDFTRHDITMGGSLPDDFVGETVGKITRDYYSLKAIQVGDFLFESGQLYFVENNGANSNIEVMTFVIDFNLKITSWSSSNTVTLGEVDAVDIDALLYNPSYLPNPESNTMVVLINGPSGPYIKMFETIDYTEVEMIGSPEEPIMTGTGTAIEVDKDIGDIYVMNDSGEVVVLKWNL